MTTAIIDVIEDEELTLSEEAAILEYEKDKQSGMVHTYSLEEVRRSLGLDS